MGKSGIGALVLGAVLILLGILMLIGLFDWLFNVVGILLLVIGGVMLIHGIYNIAKGGGGDSL